MEDAGRALVIRNLWMPDTLGPINATPDPDSQTVFGVSANEAESKVARREASRVARYWHSCVFVYQKDSRRADCFPPLACL